MAGKSTYTPERGKRICQFIVEDLLGLRKIAELMRLDKGTIRHWLAQNPDFRAEYDMAQKLRVYLMADEILEITDDTSGDLLETIDAAGRKVLVPNHANVQSRKLMVEKRQWIMSKVLPQTWGDKQQIDVRATLGDDRQAMMTVEEQREHARKAIEEAFGEYSIPDTSAPVEKQELLPPPSGLVPSESDLADGPSDTRRPIPRRFELPPEGTTDFQRYRKPRILGEWSG
jgi:hypothetical protein